MKKYLLTIAGLSLLLFGAAGALALRGGVFRLYSVQTNSMLPAIHASDVVLERRTRLQDLRVGDVISFKSLIHPGVIITHRIASIDTKSRQLTTRGDQLADPDPPVPAQTVVGKVVHRVPYVGRALSFLRTIPGLILACYLPTLYIVYREVQYYGDSRERSLYRRGERVKLIA